MAQEKVNKHGRIIKNLREVAAMTKGMNPRSGYYIQIGYIPEEGKIVVEEFVNTIGNNWVNWTKDVVPCGLLATPTSQQKLADIIDKSMKFREENGEG